MAATLTAKQLRFCHEYLVDLNGTQAAIRAGYSPKTAQEQASRLLSKVIIQNQIQLSTKSVNKKLEVSVERIVMELARIAFSDIRQFYDENGNLIPVHMLSDDAAACLAGVEEEDIKEFDRDEKAMKTIGTLTKIKRESKIKALEQLGRYKGIFEKDNSQKQPVVTPYTAIQINQIVSAIEGRKPAA